MGKVRDIHTNGNKPLFRDQIVTTGDLEDFKTELTMVIRQLLAEHKGQASKKWLKSYEVKKLLEVSTGTLQNLRDNGTLPFTKVGGTIYFDRDDIDKIMLEMKKEFRTVRMFPGK